MWHRFTPRLKDAVLCAGESAEKAGFLSTGDLLRALIADPASQAVRILARLGVTRAAVELSLARRPAEEPSVSGAQPALTGEARCAVDRAYRLAAELGDNYIGTEHFLLALLREREASDAGRVLTSMAIAWQGAAKALMAEQDHRVQAPEGVSYGGLETRRLKQKLTGIGWRLPSLVQLATNLNQPFAPYFFTRAKIKSDPYTFYARLRRQPLYYDTLIKHWVVTGYEDVAAVLAESRFSHASYAEPVWRDKKLPPLLDREFCRLEGTVRRQMLFMDAPQHTRLRGMVARQFTPAVIARMREQIQQVADEFLDRAAQTGRMDVIADFAVPYPIVIIARMLGVAESDIELFKRWSDSYITYIAGETTLEQDLAAYESVSELDKCFRCLIAQRRGEAGEDLLTLLLQANEDGERLSDEEVVANAFLLLAGGHENTTRLIGNGMLALMNHPDQLQWLREDLGRSGAAVDEMLRFDSPVQWTDRVAAEDFAWDGRKFAKGQRVLIGLAAANRDPKQFLDASRLDLSRAQNRHLALGNGPHYCLGSALTRLEGQIAFESLLSRFPLLRPDGDPVRPPSALTFRGLGSLPVRLD